MSRASNPIPNLVTINKVTNEYIEIILPGLQQPYQFDWTNEIALDQLKNSLNADELQSFLQATPTPILAAAELKITNAFLKFLEWDNSKLTYQSKSDANILHVALVHLPTSACRSLLEKLKEKESLQQLMEQRFKSLTPLFNFLVASKTLNLVEIEFVQKIKLLHEFDLIDFETNDFDISKISTQAIKLSIEDYNNLSESQQKKIVGFGCNVIHFLAARNAESLKLGLKRRPDLLNSRDRFGRTPLHIAAMKNAPVACVEYLLQQHGIDIDAKTSNNKTPEQLAEISPLFFIEIGATIGRTLETKQSQKINLIRAARKTRNNIRLSLMSEGCELQDIQNNTSQFDSEQNSDDELVSDPVSKRGLVPSC